jgi:hypothetical protein
MKMTQKINMYVTNDKLKRDYEEITMRRLLLIN